MSIIISVLVFGALYTYLYSLIPLESPFFWILWVFLGLVTSVLLMALFILSLDPLFRLSKYDNKFKHFIGHRVVNFIMIICKIKITVEGKENIPDKPFVVYANHKSMLDVLIIYKAYNTVMGAVAKSTLEKVPFLRGYMKGYGIVPVNRDNDREAARSILKGIKMVQGGYPMIIFPEGGIKSRDEEVMVNLRAGAYKLATKAEATISPVSIVGSSHISTNSPKRKTKVQLYIHKPITFEEYKEHNTFEIGEMVGKIIDEGIIDEKA